MRILDIPKKSIRLIIRGLKKALRWVAPKTYQRLMQLKHAYKVRAEFKRNQAQIRVKQAAVSVSYRQNKPITPEVKVIAFYSAGLYSALERQVTATRFSMKRRECDQRDYDLEQHPRYLDYCNLHLPKVIVEQATLAKEYGIYGFNYLFYWQNDTILLDKALHGMLTDTAIDMPFCLTWDNRYWITSEKDNKKIVRKEKTDCDKAIILFANLLDYFRDKRYICIDGKPILAIYHTDILENTQEVLNLGSEMARKAGFSGIYWITMQPNMTLYHNQSGFDAVIESFEDISQNDINDQRNLTYCSFEEIAQKAIQTPKTINKAFKKITLLSEIVCSALNSKIVLYDFEPLIYEKWLSYAVNKTFDNQEYKEDEKIIFIEAWHNWCDTEVHLKPTSTNNYAYLQATYNVLKTYDKTVLSNLIVNQPKKNNDYAVILHLFFPELWPEICQYLAQLKTIGFDLYVSVVSVDVGLMVKEKFPQAIIFITENRGRDILPFLEILPKIEALKYKAICKIHSKYTKQNVMQGKIVRELLFESLLGSEEKISAIVAKFDAQSDLGMIVPASRLLNIKQYLFPNKNNFEKLCEYLQVDSKKNQADFFPGGSMFWFKPEALLPLSKIQNGCFEIESGATDGKVEHAIERIFCVVSKASGYTVATCE
jgi:hypothetical protein